MSFTSRSPEPVDALAQQERATIINGDALDALMVFEDNSVDAIVTDPPYGLTNLPRAKVELALRSWLSGERDFIPGGRGFMSARWDRFVPPPALWDEVMRVLKPGGFLVSFAGARTVDLMGMSIRLAGFEVRDILAWIRADTFPKAPGILKSGHEPIIMARKPLDGLLEQNIARWGTGALNIEATRVPYRNAADEAETKAKNDHGRFGSAPGAQSVYGTFRSTPTYTAPGRHPSNVILDQAAADLLDSAHPITRSTKGSPRSASAGAGWGMTSTGAEHDDVGGPSRFFTIAEAPAGFAYAGRASAKERPVGEDGTKHTTVKPLSIIQWLVRLVTPAGGLLVDPFAGSGTTLEAAILEGVRVVGIDSHAPFVPLCQQRIDRALTAVAGR